MRLLAVGSVFTLLALLAACSSGNDAGQKQAADVAGDCVPNKTYPCLCGLDTGSQACTAERKYTACDCTPDAPDAARPPARGAASAPPTPTDCGNGIVDANESCDDGNTTSGDGCSATCEPDGTPDAASTCPGQSVRLWAGKTTTLAGTTVGLQNHFTASCTSGAGVDRVYAVEPSADGILTISATFAPGFDAVVELRDNACINGTPLVCENTFSAPFKHVIAVVARHRYFLVVDGFTAADAGAFAIELGLQ